MNDDDIDDLYTGTPTDEQWVELMKNPGFAEFVRTAEPPPWLQPKEEDKE